MMHFLTNKDIKPKLFIIQAFQESTESKEWLEAVLYLSESGSHNKVVFFYKKWVDS